MKKSIGSVFLALVFLTIVLSGCAPAPTPVPPAPPTDTSVPTSTPTKLPTVTPTPTDEAFVHQSAIEVLADNAARGDGTANSWGGHQSRIVHTKDGIFTAYILPGGGIHDREWRLVKRQNDGTWVVLATGNAGRNPVNLLASPDGTLHVIGWPKAVATMWSGKPENNTLTMVETKIPNLANNYYPYDSAGTDANGDLCVLSSEGGEKPIGWFKWACFIPEKNQWITQANKLDYRYAYTYVFPKPGGQLSLVSTRDVRWGVMGYNKPGNAFPYVYNKFGYWRTEDVVSEPIQPISFAEEVPTNLYPKVILMVRDAYIDTKELMHILYQINGTSTDGKYKVRHRIVAADGTTLFDGEVPEDLGIYSRIFQTKSEDFYLLGSSGLLYPMDKDGIKFGEPIMLDFNGYQVVYSGFGLSVPRTGTPLSDVIDVVFPSTDRTGSVWLYFQLDFSKLKPNANEIFEPTSISKSPSPTAKSFQEMLNSAEILFTADLNDPTLSEWFDWWTSPSDLLNISNKNSILTLNKNKTTGIQIHSFHGLRQNEACLGLFHYNEDIEFTFEAVSGEWENSTWRVWGIGNSGTQMFYQQGQKNNSESLGLRLVPGQWYYNLLWLKDQTTYVARVWDKDNPEVYAEKELQMSDTFNWAKRAWNCHLMIEKGALEMGSYQELRFTQTLAPTATPLSPESSNPQDTSPTMGTLQAMLKSASILFEADLSDPTMPGWEWWDDTHSASATESGTIIFNKEQKGLTQIFSPYGLNKNEACLALFQYSGNQGITFSAMSGNWQDETWRLWGTGAGGMYSFYQLGHQGGNYESLGYMLPGHWYYNLLWVKDQAIFVIGVWDKDNPEVYAEKVLKMSDLDDAANWTDRVWNCHLSVENGMLEMGSYQELRFNQTP